MAWPILSCGGGNNPGGRPALSISLGVNPSCSGQASYPHESPPTSSSGGSAAVSVTAMPVTLWVSVGASERIAAAVDWLMEPLSAPASATNHPPPAADGTAGASRPKMSVDVAVSVQHVCLICMLPRHCSSSGSGNGADGSSSGRQPTCGFVAVEIVAVGSGDRLPSWQAPDPAAHEMLSSPLLR